MDARDYLFEKHLQDDDEIALAAFLRQKQNKGESSCQTTRKPSSQPCSRG